MIKENLVPRKDERKRRVENDGEINREVSLLSALNIFLPFMVKDVTSQAEGPVLLQRDNKDAALLPPAPPPSSAFVTCPAGEKDPERSFVFFSWARLINGSKPPQSCSSSYKSFSGRRCANRTEL